MDAIFGALSDGTRRDILSRVLQADRTISELAVRYQLTFAAVAKHVDVLCRAQLITKQKRGREQVITGNEAAVRETTALLQAYERLWTARFERLDQLFEEDEHGRTADKQGHRDETAHGGKGVPGASAPGLGRLDHG